MTKLTPKTIIQKALTLMGRTYWNEIPLKEISDLISANGGTLIQEDGTPWSGLLCGRSSVATINITGIKTKGLFLMWYTMESGRYEITAYLM